MQDKNETNCCEKCGKSKTTLCTVCNREYEGCSKNHLRSDQHKLMRNLLASIKELSDDELLKLAKKYYKSKEQSESPKKKPVDKKSTDNKPKKKTKSVKL